MLAGLACVSAAHYAAAVLSAGSSLEPAGMLA